MTEYMRDLSDHTEQKCIQSSTIIIFQLYGCESCVTFCNFKLLLCCHNSDYSLSHSLSGRSGQCQYMGITMFDKAVWSPKPCVTCLCSEGSVVCDEVTCPILRCQVIYTPSGECCPVCTDPGSCPSQPYASLHNCMRIDKYIDDVNVV